MNEIYVKSLMTKDVICLPPDSPLHIVANKMAEHRFSCIIIKENEKPIGILTERDFVKLVHKGLDEEILALPASKFMSSPIFTLNENNNLFDAMVISRVEKIRHIPVVNDEDNLVGLVTSTDIINAYFSVIEMQSEIIEKAVAKRTGKLKQLNADLQTLSMEDHLMKIGNRRAMEVDLGHTHSSSIRYKTPYSVILIDIDFFKLYNDFYGHQAGDDALKSVAKLLKDNIRESDRLYRYGGEEILILLPQSTSEEAEIVARKLAASIEKSEISHEKSLYNYLTVSCGGACAINDDTFVSNWEHLVKKADKNLYQAKDKGRNRSIIS